MRSVTCPYCSEYTELVSGDIIYPHRPDLSNLKFYKCHPCDAYVGCHKDGRPFGTPAKDDLRKRRNLTHKLFDQLWKDHGIHRNVAYTILACHLGISKKQCHIGMFNIEMCNRVIDFSERFLENVKR